MKKEQELLIKTIDKIQQNGIGEYIINEEYTKLISELFNSTESDYEKKYQIWFYLIDYIISVEFSSNTNNNLIENKIKDGFYEKNFIEKLDLDIIFENIKNHSEFVYLINELNNKYNLNILSKKYNKYNDLNNKKFMDDRNVIISKFLENQYISAQNIEYLIENVPSGVKKNNYYHAIFHDLFQNYLNGNEDIKNRKNEISNMLIEKHSDILIDYVYELNLSITHGNANNNKGLLLYSNSSILYLKNFFDLEDLKKIFDLMDSKNKDYQEIFTEMMLNLNNTEYNDFNYVNNFMQTFDTKKMFFQLNSQKYLCEFGDVKKTTLGEALGYSIFNKNNIDNGLSKEVLNFIYNKLYNQDFVINMTDGNAEITNFKSLIKKNFLNFSKNKIKYNDNDNDKLLKMIISIKESENIFKSLFNDITELSEFMNSLNEIRNNEILVNKESKEQVISKIDDIFNYINTNIFKKTVNKHKIKNI